MFYSCRFGVDSIALQCFRIAKDHGDGLKKLIWEKIYGLNFNRLQYICKSLMIVISGDHRKGVGKYFLYLLHSKGPHKEGAWNCLQMAKGDILSLGCSLLHVYWFKMKHLLNVMWWKPWCISSRLFGFLCRNFCWFSHSICNYCSMWAALLIL